MPQFSFRKGTIKLKDIDSIEVFTQNEEGNIYIGLSVKLRNGKTKPLGAMRVTNLEKFHTLTPHFSLKLPPLRDWKIRAPDKLSINLGMVKAEWEKKNTSS